MYPDASHDPSAQPAVHRNREESVVASSAPGMYVAAPQIAIKAPRVIERFRMLLLSEEGVDRMRGHPNR